MARKSRAVMDALAEVTEFEIPIFSTALYIRLSVEDNKKRGNSVESQISILENYIALNPELRIFDTFIDNGTTGTNFERAGFKRMMAAVEAGKVTCIIVKDLSRLGRNAIDTGYYVEKYFPLNNVRFISVNDRFDSFHDDNIHGGIIMPMKHMINEAYSLDIGRKIKAQAQQNMNDGDYIGARPPYGYLKDPGNCHKLVIDPDTAPVVRQIFEWAYDKAGLNTIVNRLNEAGVMPPSHYKQQIGLITHENLIGTGHWQTFTLSKILSDEIYTGDMVQGKSKIVKHRQVPVSKDKWIVVRNTHEPIISREIFDSVQEYREQVASEIIARGKDPYTENIFKGKVFCSCCGKNLHRQRSIRKRGPDVYWLHCISNSRIAKGTCEGVMINEDEVRMELMKFLRSQSVSPTGENLLTRQSNTLLNERRNEVFLQIGTIRQEIGRNQQFLKSLYENFVKDVINKIEYITMKAEYERQISDSMNKIEILETDLRAFEAQAVKQAEWTESMTHLQSGGELTAILINKLVDRIEVSHDKTVTATLKTTEVTRHG